MSIYVALYMIFWSWVIWYYQPETISVQQELKTKPTIQNQTSICDMFKIEHPQLTNCDLYIQKCKHSYIVKDSKHKYFTSINISEPIHMNMFDIYNHTWDGCNCESSIFPICNSIIRYTECINPLKDIFKDSKGNYKYRFNYTINGNSVIKDLFHTNKQSQRDIYLSLNKFGEWC